jgi:hypothetical protein
MNCCALILAAISCSMFALNRYRTLMTSDVLRFVLCILMAAALPAYELVGNMANVQWFLVVAAIPFTLTGKPALQRFCSLQLLIGLAISLSAPALLILMPIILWPTNMRRLSSMSFGLILGLAIQLVLFVEATSSPNTIFSTKNMSESLRATAVALSNQVILPTLLGQRHAYSLVTNFSNVGPSVFLLFVVLVTCVGTRLPTPDRPTLLSAVWLTVASMALSFETRESVRALLPDFSHAVRFGADRYFFCSCCMFTFCLALIFEQWTRRAPNGKSFRREASFLLIFLLSGVVNFKIGPLADKDWHMYAAEVNEWKEAHLIGSPHHSISVPVNPTPWHLDLPTLVKSTIL